MYAQSPRAEGIHIRQIINARVTATVYVTLPLKADRLNVITNLIAGFHLYASLKDLIMKR